MENNDSPDGWGMGLHLWLVLDEPWCGEGQHFSLGYPSPSYIHSCPSDPGSRKIIKSN